MRLSLYFIRERSGLRNLTGLLRNICAKIPLDNFALACGLGGQESRSPVKVVGFFASLDYKLVILLTL